MTEKEERLARDRAEIAARVASFRETQQKFERAREEYCETTLANALNGSGDGRSGVEAEPAEVCLPVALSPNTWNRKRIVPEECEMAGTEAGFSMFPLKCSNLARGESMKDPVCIFECRRGFHFESIAERTASSAQSQAMRKRGSDNRIMQELTWPSRSFSVGKGASCPRGWKF